MIKYGLILGCVLAGMSACIDDNSKGAHIPLSYITIETEEDTIYNDYGSVQAIKPEVSQTIAGKELAYEWRVRYMVGAGEDAKGDSLKFVSTEPVLEYTFPKLGEFQVRLRVTNGDVNEMHFFTVLVQTPFNEGLLVLSADEQKKGRTSFLRAKNERDVVTGTGFEFKLHAFEAVNPEFPFNDPTDVVKARQKLLISCRESQVMYVADNRTFDLQSVLDIKHDVAWMHPVAVAAYDVPQGYADVTKFVLLSEKGDFCFFDLNSMFTYEDKEAFPDAGVYDRCYVNNEACYYFVDNTHSRVDYFMWYMTMLISKFDSGDYFDGYHINNMLVTKDLAGLWTVATNRENGKVKITKFPDTKSMYGKSPFKDDKVATQELEYAVMGELTLSDESQMVENAAYHVCFYNQGAGLYQWKQTNGVDIEPLPTKPMITVEGEITCLSSSSDEAYLYLGVWNPSAETELKGSVLVYDVEKMKVVKEYKGVADRPIKILYKKS